MTAPTIHFGKHKSKSIDEIRKIDEPYLLYLLRCDFLNDETREYIMKNVDELKFPFGKYKGMMFKSMKYHHPKYLEWVASNTDHKWLLQYI